MSIETSAHVERPARWRLARVAVLALTALIVTGAVVAVKHRQALRMVGAVLPGLSPTRTRFAGKTIPEPPSQGKPWTAPATKLPRFLLSATASLFEQGVADPRGCEYRRVEIGNGEVENTRGFVLPERADAPGRFVVGWDGLVYPAVSVGAPADLDRDVKDLAAHVKQSRPPEDSNWSGSNVRWGFPAEGQNYHGTAGGDDGSPIKICLLLRLGRADLAEAPSGAGTAWKPGSSARDLTDYKMSYLTLADAWAAAAFERLIGAHAMGDDVIALDIARRLTRFRDLATARADALGFPLEEPKYRHAAGPPTRFLFLTQLDQLLRDHERRAAMPARGPIPKKGGDPSARIAALIRDLDQIAAHQQVSWGHADPRNSPLVDDLVTIGDPAVPALLEVLESDDRLTRSISGGRGGSIERYVHPVREVAVPALTRILHTQHFENPRSCAWNSVDPAARRALAGFDSPGLGKDPVRSAGSSGWYRTLHDDSAGPARWLEAAEWIVLPVVQKGERFPKPGTRPFQGEPLRAGRDPSVTALMLRRAGPLEPTPDPPDGRWDRGFGEACKMAKIVATWDEQASLPMLQDLSKKCRERSDRWVAQANPQNADQNLAASLARFTQVRVRLGDGEALDEYAGWLRTTTPKMLEYGTFLALQPLLAQPDHPALAAAAQWLFNDPKSPWVPLLPEARGERTPAFQNLFASPLLVLASFRAGVLAGLADKTPLGTVKKIGEGFIEHKIKNLPTMSSGSSYFFLDGIPTGVEFPFRTCDYLASLLSNLEGCPKCDLFWPEARRDEAVAACVATLKRFGGRWSPDFGPHEAELQNPQTHLRFPTLEKPATREDVAAARAIFSLEGEGEARLARMPAFPQPAHWVTLKDRPVEQTEYPGGITRVAYETDGTVWQAEEVRKGDRWERFYGFVGHHVIARAPASEIEFGTQFGLGWNLKGGLQARIERVDSRAPGYLPGRPILVAMHIQNQLGVTRSSPTEFVRPGSDGKPALRKGVDLALWYSPERGPRSFPDQIHPKDVIEPKRPTHFNPGAASRLLAPLDGFEAIRLDLNDWFDLTKPGTYRVRATFAAGSGLGEGSSSEAYFQVGDDE